LRWRICACRVACWQFQSRRDVDGVAIGCVVEEAPATKIADDRRPGMDADARVADLQLQLFDADKRLDLTVHYLAQSRLERLFEWIYGQIFGSQIAALRSLMAVPSGQMTLADVISYFDNVKSSEGARYQNVSFDQWSAFLRNQQLILVVGDRVEITDLGTDFLLFLSARGRPENKSL
jgi:hypothetical protein